MRGRLTGVRLQAVEQAFESLDRQNLNQIDVRDMMRQYNPSADPSVQDGRHTAQEAFDHFKETFNAHHKEEAREWCTFHEFAEFYTDWSALIESDNYFLKLINGTWNLEKRGTAIKNKRPSSAYNLRPKNHGG